MLLSTNFAAAAGPGERLVGAGFGDVPKQQADNQDYSEIAKRVRQKLSHGEKRIFARTRGSEWF
jgi:hypothetical protein